MDSNLFKTIAQANPHCLLIFFYPGECRLYGSHASAASQTLRLETNDGWGRKEGEMLSLSFPPEELQTHKNALIVSGYRVRELRGETANARAMEPSAPWISLTTGMPAPEMTQKVIEERLASSITGDLSVLLRGKAYVDDVAFLLHLLRIEKERMKEESK